MINNIKLLVVTVFLNGIAYGQSNNLKSEVSDTSRFSCYCDKIDNQIGMIITSNYISEDGIEYIKLKFKNISLLNTTLPDWEENYFDLYRISNDSIFFRKGGVDTISYPIKSKETLFGTFIPNDNVSNNIETSNYLGNSVIKVLKSKNKYYHPLDYKYFFTFNLVRLPELNYPLINSITLLQNGEIVGYNFYNGYYNFDCRKLL